MDVPRHVKGTYQSNDEVIESTKAALNALGIYKSPSYTPKRLLTLLSFNALILLKRTRIPPTQRPSPKLTPAPPYCRIRAPRKHLVTGLNIDKGPGLLAGPDLYGGICFSILGWLLIVEVPLPSGRRDDLLACVFFDYDAEALPACVLACA